MLKAIPILVLLISVTSGVSAQGLLGGSNNISILPFNPIGFTRFILYMITLPFRIIGSIFGFGSMGRSGGTEVSNNGSGGGIFGLFLELPRGIARFMEEIFHFIRVLLDSIFGNLEGGAAYIAGDGTKSEKNRNVRNNTART